MEIEHKDFIGIYRNACDLDYCQRMIDRFEEISSKNASVIIDNKIQYGGAHRRKDEAIFFDEYAPELAAETNRILDNCMKEYINEYVGLDMYDIISQEVKVQRTLPKGGYHLWHAEQGTGSWMESTRCLVWTIYLNDISEGQGETEFINQSLRVHPKAGTVCLFPAAWTHLHRGNLTLTDTKYIATGWYNLANNGQ